MRFGAIMAVLLLLLAMTFGWAVSATQNRIYNGGYHTNCGGAWCHCPRDMSGNWYYCDVCGVQKKFN